MNKKRIFILILCIFEFFFFIFFMIMSALILFHIAVLAFPIYAVLWTLFIFDIIWLVTLKYNLKLRIIWSFITGYYTYFILFVPLFALFYSEEKTTFCLIAIIVSSIIALILGIYIIINIIKLIKKTINYIKNKYTAIKNIENK